MYSWLAAVVFCEISGTSVELHDDDAFELVMAAAAGTIDVEEIANMLFPDAP